MIKRLAIATFLLCLLSACGNKGPLVMPDAPAEAPVTPPATETAPATNPEGASGTPAAHR
ncbi:MAG TPA: lipoprotein [Thermomonas sp.]|nr:lipoprotein [Thermomonas sp.]